jgi:hypothetical protein
VPVDGSCGPRAGASRLTRELGTPAFVYIGEKVAWDRPIKVGRFRGQRRKWRMSRAAHDERVVVMLNGPTERLVLETVAALCREYPRWGGPAFEHAAGKLAARLQPAAISFCMAGFALLVSEIAAAGRLPRIRQGRGKPASRDELFLVALIGAAQRNDRGRAIEAAIALLDTGDVNRAVAAARVLGTRLTENGLALTRVGSATFDHVAGYPAVEDPIGHPCASAAATRAPARPALHLLQSA